MKRIRLAMPTPAKVTVTKFEAPEKPPAPPSPPTVQVSHAFEPGTTTDIYPAQPPAPPEVVFPEVGDFKGYYEFAKRAGKGPFTDKAQLFATLALASAVNRLGDLFEDETQASQILEEVEKIVVDGGFESADDLRRTILELVRPE